MARPGIRDLVGRAMIDRDFLADLVREPALMLAEFDLSSEERAAIMQAVGKTGRQHGARARPRAPGRADEALGDLRHAVPARQSPTGSR